MSFEPGRLRYAPHGKLFLCTDDFNWNYASYKENDVVFVREPSRQPYGKVAMFRDPWGNLWDLLQPGSGGQDGKA
ncbi:MAG: glyoxalase [Rhodoferax sp.]|nr:glyoxalase [Rhodoferax sp.]